MCNCDKCCVGPRGCEGPQGPIGPTGSDGPTGPTGPTPLPVLTGIGSATAEFDGIIPPGGFINPSVSSDNSTTATGNFSVVAGNAVVTTDANEKLYIDVSVVSVMGATNVDIVFQGATLTGSNTNVGTVGNLATFKTTSVGPYNLSTQITSAGGWVGTVLVQIRYYLFKE